MKEFDPVHAAAHGYTREDWDEVDSPELTDEELAAALPLKEAMPDLYKTLVERIDEPEDSPPGRSVLIPIDDDVAEKFRRSGDGWQARVNEVLRKAKV